VDAETLKIFEECGVVKLRGVFPPTQAERMRDVVWRDLFHSEGVVQEDRGTWRRQTPRTKLARAKRHPVFDALFGEQLRELAEVLLGSGWSTSAAYGNLLVDFPDAINGICRDETASGTATSGTTRQSTRFLHSGPSPCSATSRPVEARRSS
jgi:hypothetical protein